MHCVLRLMLDARYNNNNSFFNTYKRTITMHSFSFWLNITYCKLHDFRSIVNPVNVAYRFQVVRAWWMNEYKWYAHFKVWILDIILLIYDYYIILMHNSKLNSIIPFAVYNSLSYLWYSTHKFFMRFIYETFLFEMHEWYSVVSIQFLFIR